MFKKKPVIEYESVISYYPNSIQQAKKHIPEWYKKIPKWSNNEIFTIENGFQFTVKNCVPVLDSFTTGYMLTLPCDVYVKNVGGRPFITGRESEKCLPDFRENVSNLNFIPKGHYPVEFVWHTNAAITFPVGYSVLLTHPLNRHDLPFTTLSGVIDGGLVMDPYGRIPFYVKDDFEGIIPQGTPIAQIIPFRQEKWLSKIKKGLIEKALVHASASGAKLSGWYKTTFWTKKNYE